MNLCQPQVSIWVLLLSSVNPDGFDTDNPSDCSVLTGGLPLRDLISFHVGGFRDFSVFSPSAASVPCPSMPVILPTLLSVDSVTALSPLCNSLSPGDAAGLYQSRFLKEFAEQELHWLTQLFAIYLPVDQSGTAWELGEAMAAQCGYTVTYSTWGSIEFRASALSCHSHLEVSLLQTLWLQCSCTLHEK